MASYTHCHPTRLFMIGMVRKFGTAIVDGAEGMSPEAVIAHYETLSDADWAAEHGCDHHDARGHCLGHERADGAPAASLDTSAVGC